VSLRVITITAVRTNIRAQGRKKFSSFHWLESWTETIDEATGEPSGMTITLPDWLYDGVVARGGVLTIHQDYFLLTGGIERWLYRVVRKHAGNQEQGWQFTMKQLHEKSGSAARLSDFAIDIRQVVQANALPEYELSMGRDNRGNEVVYFLHRMHLPCNQNLAFSLTSPQPNVHLAKSQPCKVGTLPADDTGD
jgi:plasmid replication initiation protein